MKHRRAAQTSGFEPCISDAWLFVYMNLEQLRKNTGRRVQLVPPAQDIDESGLHAVPVDDDWIIVEVRDEGVRVSNVRTSHATILGKDHIYSFSSNPNRSAGGLEYGFLILHVQIFMRGMDTWVRPNTRPGSPVEVIATIVDKWVDINYPRDSGLQLRLESAGYRVAWCFESKVVRKTDIDGWEVAIEPDSSGQASRFHLKDLPENQILIKKLLSAR
jgi:hypothetical protein